MVRRLESLSLSKMKHPREWAVFSSIDTNGDGLLDRDEVAAMCDQFGFGDLSDAVASILDEDGDGAVTFQELLGAFDELGELRREARLHSWSSCFGLGVAGNVAGHMAQAGEAATTDGEQKTPAAVFAFYVPEGSKERLFRNLGSKTSLLRKEAASRDTLRLEAELERLERFPVTTDLIEYPDCEGAAKVQVEPEMALLCDIVYRSHSLEGKTVEALLPRKIAAFNDCSIRELRGSEKLSERKNWGFGSKGISLDGFDLASVREFEAGGLASRLALTSYVKRDGKVHQYTETAPGRNYLLYHGPLLDWIRDQLNDQRDADKWEDMAQLLRAANYPSSMWIALGAGEYTAWGQENYIQPKDETVVVVFDETVLGVAGPSMDMVEGMFNDTLVTQADEKKAMVFLHQTFVKRDGIRLGGGGC